MFINTRQYSKHLTSLFANELTLREVTGPKYVSELGLLPRSYKSEF